MIYFFPFLLFSFFGLALSALHFLPLQDFTLSKTLFDSVTVLPQYFPLLWEQSHDIVGLLGFLRQPQRNAG
jgi:hypothetical protein